MLKYIQVVCVPLWSVTTRQTLFRTYYLCLLMLLYSEIFQKSTLFAVISQYFFGTLQLVIYMDMTVFRIIELIEEKKITASRLTSDLELSNSAVTDWKKGKAKPSAEAIIKIAKYFNVSTDFIYGLTDDPTPAQELSAARVAGGRDYSDLTPEQIEKIKSYEAFLRSQSNLEEK